MVAADGVVGYLGHHIVVRHPVDVFGILSCEMDEVAGVNAGDVPVNVV